jgi:hypothetical protein
MLFLLKIAITPLLVAAVSLAARWWGPTVGGILMGLPWFTGPTLFVLVQDRGTDFGVAACIGIQMGVVCLSAYMLTYSLIALVARWPLSLMGAIAAFAATAWATLEPVQLSKLTLGIVPSLWLAAAAAATCIALIGLLLPRPRTPPVLQFLPWWDIPLRMIATGAVVSLVVITADALGPQLSGVASSFPVIVTVVGTFTHHRWGRDAIWRMLRGLAVSLFAFIAFFLVVGLTLPSAGLIGAYVLAASMALAMTTGLFVLNRVRAVR